MTPMIRFIVFVTTFVLGSCSNVKSTKSNDLSIKYEIINIKSCSSVTHIEGGGHLYAKGATTEINLQERYFLSNDDMIYLEKDSLAIIEAPDKSKILLNSTDKKSSYRLRIDTSETECSK